MKRRQFIIGTLATCGLMVTARAQAGLSMFDHIRNINPLQRAVQLNSNQVYIAKSKATFYLPKNPKHGDLINIIVDQSSMTHPCVITDQYAKVIGEYEPLILDSMAILKFTFEAQSKNWKLA